MSEEEGRLYFKDHSRCEKMGATGQNAGCQATGEVYLKIIHSSVLVQGVPGLFPGAQIKLHL